ncbi:unnamed protein product [Calicophoron daubneyi]|uniref:Kinesin motor domain-containing protein n=1 Tax=Calicophoron daubneyi TaxID=300641 RepID=A0AAV2TU68_CALDB
MVSRPTRITKARRFNANTEVQPVQVFCRVKPNRSALPSCVEIIDEKTLRTVGSRAGSQREALHTFTAVFPEDVSQELIFEKVALPLVSEFIEGKNGLLLTYGATGSGKTFAMLGSSKEPGILPMALDVVFNSLDNKQTKKYVVKPDGFNGFDVQSESDAIMDRHRLDYQQRLRHPRSDLATPSTTRPRSSNAVSVPENALYAVFISLIEVYNNSVFDLLQESPEMPGKTLTTHVLREDPLRNIYVSGCVEVEVKTADDALRIFSTGQKRRRIGQTALNAESSRSHCVFTMRLVRTGYDAKYDEAIEDKNLLVVSQLCLVDLAGCERANRAGTQGDRLKEASSINSSLMNLRKCIEVLREIQAAGQGNTALSTPGGTLRVVPYRDRRLTHLFKNFFEGNGRVVMLVCIQQSLEDYEETMHVLKFAETTQDVQTFRTPVIPPSPASYARRLRQQTPCRDSGQSTSTSDSTISVANSDEHISSILTELSTYTSEIDRYLARFLNNTTTISSDLDSDDITSTDEKVETDCSVGNPLTDCRCPTPDQEQTQRIASNVNRSLMFDTYQKVDVEPLRALLTNRRNCRKRARSVLESDFAAFRANLVDLTNIEPTTLAQHSVSNENLERTRYAARISQLENQLAEAATSAKRERSERVLQVERYRKEAERLRAQLDRLLVVEDRENKKSSEQPKIRPSVSQPNLVSVLSRQWENRLAEQRAEVPFNTAHGKGGRTNLVGGTANATSPRRAAFNPRHRRSRSAGGDTARWLEHQESNATPLGTILSPSLKLRKSVTQLEMKDTLNATNYVLHHQEADAEGNIETKLYKGCIIPTAGGGSAVIFNDVEELRQTSPLMDGRGSTHVKESKTSRKSSPGGGVTSDTNNFHDIRRSSKRRRSSSATQRHSSSSTNTQSSLGSEKTTASSNYRPVSPPIVLPEPPLLGCHLNSEMVAARCRIGISSTGGIGAFAPPATHNLRKRSKI